MNIKKICYITYINSDRHEYYLWGITDNKNEAIEDFKSNCLTSFVGCKHSEDDILNLVRVSLSNKKYKMLYDAYQTGKSTASVEDYLEDLDDSGDYVEIYSCDGSIGLEFVDYYHDYVIMPEDVDDDTYDELYDKFYGDNYNQYEWLEKLEEFERNNPVEYKKLVKKFIDTIPLY